LLLYHNLVVQPIHQQHRIHVSVDFSIVRNRKQVTIFFPAINLDCISIVNGVPNSFYTNGCSKQLGKFSVDETLGIVVINSFLVIVALAAIPVLIGKNAYEASPQNGSMNQSIPQNQQQYTDGQYNPEMSYNNFNSAPIEYY
jgi:hypothetical protein